MIKAVKKIAAICLFSLVCIMPTLPAMAPVRNRAAGATRAFNKATFARFSTGTPSQGPVSTIPPTQKLHLDEQFSNSNEETHQRTWQQTKVKDSIKKALGITGAITIAAVIAQATEIADLARKNFSLYLFDEGLIPDEFSRAIVNLYREQGGKCSGCIIASEKYPDLYFVLTAAHCLDDESNHYIRIRHLDKNRKIKLTQILADPSTDVAVLFIPPQEIRKFQDATGTQLPAISAKQLARIKPSKDEVIVLQGYPTKVPFDNFYREKFMTAGPEAPITEGAERITTKLVPLENYSPQTLRGASGAPYIGIRGNSPEILGIHSAVGITTLDDRSKVRTGPVHAGGFGKLPGYLQEAEENARKLQEAKQNAP